MAYLIVFNFALTGLALGAAALLLGRRLAARLVTEPARRPFESGAEPEVHAWHQYHVRFSVFLADLHPLRHGNGVHVPGLPSGLEVKLNLQGERIASVGDVTNWFPERSASEVASEPALRAAMGHDVPATELERLRIRSHLRAMATMLDLAGLEGVARRFLTADPTEPRRLRRLFRAAEWRGLRRVLQGVGRISRDQAKEIGLAGPPARASGLGEDARASDRAYRGADFEPVTAPGGDAWARWTVLRDECLQSAAMLSGLGERTTRAAEGPHGPWLVDADGVRGASRANVGVLEQVLPGLLWPEALLTIASLDLDVREAAIR